MYHFIQLTYFYFTFDLCELVGTTENDLASDDDLDTDSLLPDDSSTANNPMMQGTTAAPSKPSTNTTASTSSTTTTTPSARFASFSAPSSVDLETSHPSVPTVCMSAAPSDGSNTPGMYNKHQSYKYLFPLLETFLKTFTHLFASFPRSFSSFRVCVQWLCILHGQIIFYKLSVSLYSVYRTGTKFY